MGHMSDEARARENGCRDRDDRLRRGAHAHARVCGTTNEGLKREGREAGREGERERGRPQERVRERERERERDKERKRE